MSATTTATVTQLKQHYGLAPITPIHRRPLGILSTENALHPNPVNREATEQQITGKD